MTIPTPNLDLQPFQSLPDQARLWVFALPRSLEEGEVAPFRTGISDLLGSWRHKGTVYEPAWTLVEGRLLVVAEAKLAQEPSGCAIDGMVRRVNRLVLDQLGEPCLGEGELLAWDEGHWVVFHRDETAAFLWDGRLHARSLLVQRALYSLGQLRAGTLFRVLSATWIGHKYGLVAGLI